MQISISVYIYVCTHAYMQTFIFVTDGLLLTHMVLIDKNVQMGTNAFTSSDTYRVSKTVHLVISQTATGNLLCQTGSDQREADCSEKYVYEAL